MRKTIAVLILGFVAAVSFAQSAGGRGGLSTIQMQNSGTNYGTAMTGRGTLNFSGCTVSGTSPNFTVTCSGGTPGGTAGQVQYNNSGAFGGTSAITVSSSTAASVPSGSTFTI